MANYIYLQTSTGIDMLTSTTLYVGDTYRVRAMFDYTGHSAGDHYIKLYVPQISTLISLVTLLMFNGSESISENFQIPYIEGLSTSTTTFFGVYDFGGTAYSYIMNQGNFPIQPLTISAPTFNTYPTSIAGTDNITLSWSSASTSPSNHVNGYILSRSVNGGAFTQLYNGFNRNYTDTAVKTTWNTVVYRVNATTDVTGQSGGIATTNTISVNNSLIKLNVASAWKSGTPFIRASGAWKQGTPYVRVGGVWKKL